MYSLTIKIILGTTLEGYNYYPYLAGEESEMYRLSALPDVTNPRKRQLGLGTLSSQPLGFPRLHPSLPSLLGNSGRSSKGRCHMLPPILKDCLLSERISNESRRKVGKIICIQSNTTIGFCFAVNSGLFEPI